MDEIEPLDFMIWTAALEKLRARWVVAPLGDLEAQVRHASHLVRLAPFCLRDTIRLELSEDEFEAVLEDGRIAEAVDTLIGAEADHTRTGHDGNAAESTVAFPGRTSTHSQRSTDPASASLGAWLDCLLELAAMQQTQASRRRPPGEPSGRHLRLIPR